MALVASAFITSCKNNEAANNNAITEIVSGIEQKQYKIGDKIDINFSNLEDVDNVKITIDGKVLQPVYQEKFRLPNMHPKR